VFGSQPVIFTRAASLQLGWDWTPLGMALIFEERSGRNWAHRGSPGTRGASLADYRVLETCRNKPPPTELAIVRCATARRLLFSLRPEVIGVRQGHTGWSAGELTPPTVPAVPAGALQPVAAFA